MNKSELVMLKSFRITSVLLLLTRTLRSLCEHEIPIPRANQNSHNTEASSLAVATVSGKMLLAR